MILLREHIERLRKLPGQVAKAATGNWVLHYLSQHGHMPDGWEMVFGAPLFTGRKRSKKKKKKQRLAKTYVLMPSLKLEGATLSAAVNPDVRDVNPVPVPKTGGTSAKTFHRAFRANITSGDRTKHHHDDPHQPCPVYDPACRDREWATPVWIGGTDWATRPLYRHQPPDVRKTFAQDPSGQIPADVPLATGPPGFIPPNKEIHDSPKQARDADAAAAAFSDIVDESEPYGLVSKIASAAHSTVSDLRKAWLSLSKSGSSAMDIPLPPRRRRRDSEDTTPPVFALRPMPEPGTPEHDAALYKQAVYLRQATKRPYYVVDYNGRRAVTSRPQKHAKVLYVVEATTSASFPTQTSSGTTFYGRRGLKVIEKERQTRMARQSSSKCAGYDPKCRDKDWEVPAVTGGVNLSLIRR